jgi:hypothetical protein
VRGALVAVGAGVLLAAGAASAERPPFDPGRVSFSVEVKGEVFAYRVLGIYVMPAERVRVRVVGDRSAAAFSASAEAGTLEKRSDRAWDWTAPSAGGPWAVTVSRSDSGESMRLNAFVMEPAAEVRNGELNGYVIGEYPAKPLKGLPLYNPPRGFIEVTEDNADAPVSPHFTIGQFLCKEDGGYPKYLVLRERLILKLELILEHTNASGFRCDGFVIMSGYRTPSHNRAIGNVKYSRHLWGGAADIFIDESPRDGVMDDLNGDGKIGLPDAEVLYDLIDELYGRPFYAAFLGGLGRYSDTDSHGPFVHVDVRGFRARWGD